jgi:hypothetical protein
MAAYLSLRGLVLQPNHQKPVSLGKGGFASAILNPSSSNLYSYNYVHIKEEIFMAY